MSIFKQVSRKYFPVSVYAIRICGSTASGYEKRKLSHYRIQAAAQSGMLGLCVSMRSLGVLVVHKEHRYAPYTCESDENVNYSGYQGCGAAADPCDEVKREQSYKTPVERAYNGEHKRDFVRNHHNKCDRILLYF